MESIPLAEGDLRWTFGQSVDLGAIREIVFRAQDQLGRLAEVLGASSGWVSSGLEFGIYPAMTIIDLRAWVESDNLDLPAFCVGVTPQESPDDGPRWDVDCDIAVRCYAQWDCGMHAVEELPTRSYDSPETAAAALLAAATWLLERGTAEPVDSWRRRDPGCASAP
ncbi:hypothetical protein Aph01nite_69430 [Acrocarpospora phusangensis]|uniref:Uncharacterized protein n=1 Tax=Acrocarpospora phusangensis TaxID=1070424 RepID=A0A919QJ68_9ACTN|nr:hypothetical protein [Acrocarpospora phusangensis]GIH28633.1 hypothetical protein Aph01nite_69430 [Acrocarpospora phusangensis]